MEMWGDGLGSGLGAIAPRVDAVWVTPEQMQMLFRASNGNVLAQCKKNFAYMEIALCCTICKERYAMNSVAHINAGNIVGGPLKVFLDAHKHPIVETELPSSLPKAQTEPVTRRIKESHGY